MRRKPQQAEEGEEEVLKTVRRECVESTFDFVISGSTYFLNALAFAKVVFILLCIISDEAIFANMAFLWLLFRLS